MPSSRKPVELGLAPRTTGNGSSDTTDATPGQRLDHAERIAEGAGDLLDLGAAQRDARDLLAALFADDHDLVGVVAIALDEVADRQLLRSRQRLLLQERVVARRIDRHAGGPGRQRQPEPPARVGLALNTADRPTTAVTVASGDRRARAELDQLAAQHGGPGRSRVDRPGRAAGGGGGRNVCVNVISTGTGAPP